MHLKRLIVAAVFLPAIYFYIMYLPSGYFLLILILTSLLAMSEFYHMYRVTGILRYSCLFLGSLIILVSYIWKEYTLDVIMLSLIAVMCVRLIIKRNPLAALHDISPPAVGLLYIPGFFTFQMQIRTLGPEWIIFLYASAWMSDSMAYYLGKGIGKRKLYREVSPNKTVAGAAGSLIGGVIGALLVNTIFISSFKTFSIILIGIMIGAVSVIGDLIESMFKRDAGVKDSSLFIPGHGGILDKIDSALFAGPVLYWVLKFAGIMKY
ncbi:MAG: phosphatidate cytidylyltransferase [Nitrospirae bacterium]|jgi:phosphatidate cytidylyltransferase|nr:phosphatidate cytidylyltransferase [Nitrospirota bacterium]